MKRLNSTQIALAFSGSFVGAGLVSGQELYQFFCVFGWYGVFGSVLTTVTLVVFGIMAMTLAREKNQEQFDYIIAGDENELFRKIISTVVLILMFGIMVIMIAGGGSLLMEKLGVKLWTGNLITAILVLLATYFGMSGLIKVFELMMPFLVITAVGISLIAAVNLPTQPIVTVAFSGENPLIGNWVAAAVTYISYNVLAAIIIFVPIAARAKDTRAVKSGAIKGGVILLIIFLSMIMGICTHIGSVAHSEMPMLTLASEVGTVAGNLYAVLLYFGVFASTLSVVYAMRIKMSDTAKVSKNIKTIALLAMAFILSLLGFKNLVSTIFPVCGYVGLIMLYGIAKNFAKYKKENGTEK